MTEARRRNFKRRKPLRKLARKATRKKSDWQQAKQIKQLALHVSDLKEKVKEETSMPALYSMAFQSPVLTVNQYNYNAIIPLTCGVSQKNQKPYQPVTNLNLPQVYAGVLGWDPMFQPRELHPTSGAGNRASVPPFIRVYNQHCKLKFWAGTLKQSTDLTVSVLRIRKDGPIANLKSIAQRLDGLTHEGPQPDATNPENYIKKDRDYASSAGVTFNQAAPDPTGTGIPQFPTPNYNGDTNLMWNKEFYEVEYQKQFTLGAARSAQYTSALSAATLPTEPLQALAQNIPDDNQFSEEVKFTVNYGGLKMSSVPIPDTTLVGSDPMVVTDMRYDQIPPEHKRWLVITSSNPEIGASVYAPYMQFSSYISTRVPV